MVRNPPPCRPPRAGATRGAHRCNARRRPAMDSTGAQLLPRERRPAAQRTPGVCASGAQQLQPQLP